MSLTLDPRTVPPSTGRVGSPDEVVSPPVRSRLRVTGPRREIVAVIDPVWALPGNDVTTRVRPPAEVVRAAAGRLTRFLQPGEVVAATDDGRLTLRLRHEDRAARPVRLQEMAYHAVETLDSLGERDRSQGVVDLGVGWAHISRKQAPAQAERHAAEAAAESVRERDLQPRLQGAHLRQRRPRVNLWTAGHQVLLATVGVAVVPFLALVGLYALGLDLSSVVYWTLVTALAGTAALIWFECSYALDPERPPAQPAAPAPRATAVIAAYLPNEADTIVETVEHFLTQQYAGGLQVVLAYNTPVPLAVEDELAAMAEQHPDLLVLKVPDSTSKAQNVNAALRVAEGEFVGIFDADHHPMQGEASVRVLEAGGRIVNDPGLVSRELAPETPRALWNQRMRWAQGWFQVSLRHFWSVLRSPVLTLRQRLGVVYLLGWREAYPWVAVSAWPLLGFYAWRDGGLDLTSPMFLLLTLFTTVSGPLQTLAAWRLAAPEVRRHRGWFVGAALANVLFYTELKNVVNRVAHLKQLRGERRWVVTPRSAASTGSTDGTDTDLEVAA